MAPDSLNDRNEQSHGHVSQTKTPPLDNPVDDAIMALTHALARAIELIPDHDSRLVACARAMREVVEKHA
jgi:hypothetical protein